MLENNLTYYSLLVGLPALFVLVMTIMKYKYQWYLVLLPFSALIDVTIYYLKGTVPIGEIRIALVLIYIIVIWKRIKTNHILVLILMFQFYLLVIMIFNSSAISESAIQYSKQAIGALMFAIGFTFINSKEKLRELCKVHLICGLIITLQFFIAQFTNLGNANPYLADSGFRLGGSVIQVTYVSAILFALLSVFASKKVYPKMDIMIPIVLVLSLIMVLLLFRRISVLTVVMSLVLTALFGGIRTRAFRYVVILTVSLLPIFFVFQSNIEDLLRKRQSKELADEGRIIETAIVYSELTTGSTTDVLFGKELFNSASYFDKEYQFFRQLHIDYNQLVHGSGVVGLIFYLLIYIAMLLQFLKNKPDEPYRTAFLTLFVVSLMISISGSLSYFTYRAILFIYFGAFIAISAREKQERLELKKMKS